MMSDFRKILDTLDHLGESEENLMIASSSAIVSNDIPPIDPRTYLNEVRGIRRIYQDIKLTGKSVSAARKLLQKHKEQLERILSASWNYSDDPDVGAFLKGAKQELEAVNRTLQY